MRTFALSTGEGKTMSDQITMRKFRESDGVEDWRVVGEGACAYFRTGSFAAGARLVRAIGELAREISALAPEMGVSADPSAVQTVQVTIDALVGSVVMPFWRAVLGYEYS